MSYSQVPQQDSPPGPSVPTPTSPKNEGVNLGFTKAALAFSHQLDGVRNKRTSVLSGTTAATPTTPSFDPKEKQSAVVVSVVPEEEKSPPAPAPDENVIKLNRRIRILRIVQSTLTAIFSLSIAIFQAVAYNTFRRTEGIDNAWPPVPFLAPTIMLLIVAIVALIFDISLLTAYLLPKGKIADRAAGIAMKAHSLATSAKTISYVLTAVICREGYNQGNASGNNPDLWSWTCANQNSPESSVNNAATNCTLQSLAWYFSLVNIAVEVIGFAIDKLAARREAIAQEKGVDAAQLGNPAEDEKYAKFEQMRTDVEGEIVAYSPPAKS